ncbi:MAG: LysM peptidoglycan-binding domain-containing protein [Bacteroidota bacterium]
MKNQIHPNYQPNLLALSMFTLFCFLTVTLTAQNQAKQQKKVLDPYSGQIAYADAHLVQHGETLFGISNKYKMTITELKVLNNLQSDIIHAGELLAISSPKSSINQVNKRVQAPELNRTVAVQRSSAPETASTSYQLYRYSHVNTEGPFDWEAPSPDAPEYSYLNKRRGEVSAVRGSEVTDDQAFSDPLTRSSNSRGTSDNLASANRRTASPTASASGTSLRRTYHEVQAGENIYLIAELYGVPVEEIRESNGIAAALPGQTLVINPPENPDDREDMLASQNRESSYRLRSVRTGGSSAEEEVDEWDNTPLYTSLDVLNETSTSLDVLNPEYDPARRYAKPRGESDNPVRRNSPSDLSPTYNSAVKTASPPASMLLNGSQDQDFGEVVEVLKYGKYENSAFKGKQFYAVHKELPIGTRMNMPIPNNVGFVEVEVVARLHPTSKFEIGLSPSCIQLLQNGENKERVTLFHNMVN